MFKVTKETAHSLKAHKCNLGTERSAKIVLEELKNKEIRCGHQVCYDGDSLTVTNASGLFICTYKMEKQ